MQMSHFPIDLTPFQKSGLDLTRVPTRQDPVDCQERLCGVSEGHVAPVPPYDKETMFEKPLTPSDVGKLNRLVIPKQFAEKYFPLGGGADVAGTLLGFEDEAGKCWRFRYSYWNSSQSYVLTKGWSRYVKEKSLDAGDAVVFARHRTQPERLFIGCRRRGEAPAPAPFGYNAQGYGVAQDTRRGHAVGAQPYHGDRRRVAAEEDGEEEAVNGNGRRLVRLFGVNFECQQAQPSRATTSSTHPQPIQTQQEAYRNYFNYMGIAPPTAHHHHHHHVQER